MCSSDLNIRAWRASLKIPLKIFSTDSELPMTFGIMPQAHAGLSASSFTPAPPSAAVGGSIFMDLGFPVGIRISPEFYYQISQSRFAFRFTVEVPR